jgi:rare lipoprotein A (peptidoglycan hydrolase)
VRLPRVVAGVALIVVLALAALPGAVGSRTPSGDPAIDSTLFQRVDRASALQDTAATTFSLDPTIVSAATLEPHSTLVEPATAAARGERPRAVMPAPARGVVGPAIGFVTAGAAPTAGAPSGWRRDPDVSWYGPGFYGNRTACGKTLTTTLLGVAHKTLPCGTMVSFRNPSNGRVVTVPVVDRGPYVAGRQWDLTAGACKAIAHCYTGPLFWRFP